MTVSSLEFHNAVNLTEETAAAVFRSKEIGSVGFSQMKTEAHFIRIASAFLFQTYVSLPEVLKAPFVSVGIFGMAHVCVTFIMPVGPDRYDVLAYLIV